VAVATSSGERTAVGKVAAALALGIACYGLFFFFFWARYARD